MNVQSCFTSCYISYIPPYNCHTIFVSEVKNTKLKVEGSKLKGLKMKQEQIKFIVVKIY